MFCFPSCCLHNLSFANSYFGLAAQGNIEEVDVGPDEEVADALVIQEAIAEVVRQGVGSNQAAGEARDISELFSELEAEARPEVETKAPRQARAYAVKS